MQSNLCMHFYYGSSLYLSFFNQLLLKKFRSKYSTNRQIDTNEWLTKRFKKKNGLPKGEKSGGQKRMITSNVCKGSHCVWQKKKKLAQLRSVSSHFPEVTTIFNKSKRWKHKNTKEEENCPGKHDLKFQHIRNRYKVSHIEWPLSKLISVILGNCMGMNIGLEISKWRGKLGHLALLFCQNL